MSRRRPDFDHEHAERDRYPEPAVEHVVEQRVAGIAVVDGVAREPAFLEQHAREPGGVGGVRAGGELVELAETGVEFEVGVRVRGDEERGPVEGEVGFGPGDERSELLGRLHPRTVLAARRAPVGLGYVAGMAKGTDDVRAVVAERLRGVGQRLTANREALVTTLTEAPRPLTIPEILETRRGLAQSSVYRNLVVLEEAGIVHRVVGTDEFAALGARRRPHRAPPPPHLRVVRAGGGRARVGRARALGGRRRRRDHAHHGLPHPATPRRPRRRVQ